MDWSIDFLTHFVKTSGDARIFHQGGLGDFPHKVKQFADIVYRL